MNFGIKINTHRKDKKMKVLVWMLMASLLVVFFILGCGSDNPPDNPLPPASIFDDPSTINSPHGSVHFGAKTYSPDGTRYAREVEPIYYMGTLVFLTRKPTSLSSNLKQWEGGIMI